MLTIRALKGKPDSLVVEVRPVLEYRKTPIVAMSVEELRAALIETLTALRRAEVRAALVALANGEQPVLPGLAETPAATEPANG